MKKKAEKISFHIDDNLSIENEIAIEIRIFEQKRTFNDFYFLTKPDVTVERLLDNVKMQYPEELPDSKEKYAVTLTLPVNKFLNNLTIENRSLLVIFPFQPDDKK